MNKLTNNLKEKPKNNKQSDNKLSTGKPTTPQNTLGTAAHNWYAKLHPIGKKDEPAPSSAKNGSGRSQPLNLSIFFRIWLAVAIIIVISSIVAFNQLFDYVKPNTQQVIEDTLVDTSKLLAASLKRPIQTGEIYNDAFQATLDQAFLNQSATSSSQTSSSSQTNSPTQTNSNTQAAGHLTNHLTSKNGLTP